MFFVKVDVVCYRRELEQAVLLLDDNSDSELEDLMLLEWDEVTKPIGHQGQRITTEALCNEEALVVINDYRFAKEDILRLVDLLRLPQSYTAPNGTKATGKGIFRQINNVVNLIKQDWILTNLLSL